MDKDFIIMGSWAIYRKTGNIRCRLCRIDCSKFNYDNTGLVKIHNCNVKDEEDDPNRFQERHIPAIVRDTARTLQNARNEQFRREVWQRAHPGKPYPENA